MNKNYFMLIFLLLIFISCDNRRQKISGASGVSLDTFCLSKEDFVAMHKNLFNKDCNKADDFTIAYISAVHANELDSIGKEKYMRICLSKYKKYFN